MRIFFSSSRFGFFLIGVLVPAAALCADIRDQKAQLAFEKSVHVFARAQHCNLCHGVDQSPLWAQNDVGAAYQLAKNYVDFSSPESSTLVIRSSNRHCGKICSTDSTAMRDAIMSWWENGEKDLSGGIAPIKKTIDLPVPVNLPTGDDFAPLEWDLGSMGLQGARFQLEIQKYDDYAYRVRKPRVVTTKQAVRVHGIRVFINGRTFPEAGNYLAITQSATADSAPVLSSSVMLVPAVGGTLDKIAIGFAEVNWGEPHACRNVALFQSKVKVTLERKCAYCHREKGNPANRAYAMPIADDAACQSARQRIDATWPILSPFVTYPLSSTDEHPHLLTERDQENFMAWIAEELGQRGN